MYKVTLESGESFACADERILSSALRNRLGFPYECNSGSCGICKFTLLRGEVRDLYPDAPGLSERDRGKGRKLACQCKPVSDLNIKVALSDEFVPSHIPTRCKAELLERKSVTHDILSIRFKTDSAFLFLPGQYALLELPGIGRRAYSMANLPNNDGDIEFYIKKVPSGKISPLLFDKSLDPSQAVYVDGPYGLAHVRESDRDRVCVAGGSGLAPMISIARHHLQSGCDRKMLFFFGGRKMQDLISESEFFSLIGGSGNIEFISAVSEDAGNADIRRGYIHEVLLSQLSGDLMDCDIYCAGPPVMVNALERSLYKISFPMERLYFDRFY